MHQELKHDILNYLQQIVNNAEYISTHSNMADYAQEIKSASFKIDALLEDMQKKEDKPTPSKPKLLKKLNLAKFKTLKVLVVDDMAENVQVIESVFATFAAKTVTALSGKEAIEVVKSGFKPDIICMDILMSDLDGFQTTALLKEMECHAYFVAISGLKNQSSDKIAFFDSWLPKPFTTEHIKNILFEYEIHSEKNNFDKEDKLAIYKKTEDTKSDKLKLFIVDDKKENLLLFIDILQPLDLDIYVTQKADEALTLAQTIEFDLILLDIVMPKIDGYELCERIKELPKHKDTPIIFVSALGSVEERVKGFEKGADDYIAKPFLQNELRARVKLHLQKSFVVKSLKHLLKRSYHELYNPLAIINTSLEMQTLKYGANDYIDAITVASRTLQVVYDDLYHSLALRYNDAHLEKIDLFEFIQKRIEYFYYFQKSKNITIKYNATQKSYITMQESDIQRLVDNTLSNAIKYAPQNSEIEITLEDNEQSVVFSTTNRGKDIVDADKIFKKQFREDFEQLGMGIGLEIVASICYNYNILSDVVSQDGVTTFTYTIAKGER